MTHFFTAYFDTRQYELNARSELPTSALLRWFQEAATLTSCDAGFGMDCFERYKTVWLIRGMTVAHARPIQYPARIAITSWLSAAHKVRVYREYLARDATTGEIVARGRANWVHVHTANFFPTRIPIEAITRFAPNGISALTRFEPRPLAPPGTPREFCATRRAQRYEADAMQHVNNAIYVDWLEETLAEAVADLTGGARRLCVHRHDLEYLRSAVPGDALTLSARLVGAGQCASAWQMEVHRGEELLVRDRVTALWRDQNGKPLRNKW